ncbi:MAG: sulfatase-like hydrolase/transferase [Planctomycetes bacterium]|nr:sulfatase-like hydrolase/transferase [Planctomycetota bacterium]
MPLKRNNVLLITSDQQHWFTLGLQNPEIKTPNLDRLARSGMLCTRAYTPNPTCTPTRASIITGKYPSQHGAWTLGTKLSEDEHTVGEDFQKAGYRTALVGKAHFQPLAGTEEYPSLEAYPVMQDLDFWRNFKDDFYGFDHVELARNHTDEAHVGQHYAIWMESKGFTNWRECFSPPTGTRAAQKHVWNIPEEFHYNTWIAERSCALLEDFSAQGKNFFLWSSFFDPHPSYLVPEPWASMYDPAKITVPGIVPGEHDSNPPHHQLTQQKGADFSPWKASGMHNHGMHCHLHGDGLAKDIAVYYGMISMMDKYIGLDLDKIETLGLSDNTLVVFSTDHGHFYGHHGLVAKGPFHYEDMVRIPFIVRWPGHVPQEKTSSALQSLVDLAPSFLSACGIAVPRGMSGVDQTAVWRGEAEEARDHVLVENHHEHPTIHLKTYIDSRYKLTVYFNQTYGELYDLQEDPRELHNLWDDPKCLQLKSDLLLRYAWAELGKEPMWMPRVHSA